jgi:hypothetical protein
MKTKVAAFLGGHERSMENAPIALVDMDGTLCDCAGAIAKGFAELRGPYEDARDEEKSDPPAHIVARRRLIMSVPGFWRNLERLPLGFHLVEVLRECGFQTHILTKGPSDQSLGWMEKFDWCRRHVPGIPIIMTEDKALVHGAVLVEDWPPYIARWLRTCPRGLVIVPAQPWNTGTVAPSSPRLIRYNGTKLDVVRKRLEEVRRTAGMPD